MSNLEKKKKRFDFFYLGFLEYPLLGAMLETGSHSPISIRKKWRKIYHDIKCTEDWKTIQNKNKLCSMLWVSSSVELALISSWPLGSLPMWYFSATDRNAKSSTVRPKWPSSRGVSTGHCPDFNMSSCTNRNNTDTQDQYLDIQIYVQYT